jgi:hypothetical protein
MRNMKTFLPAAAAATAIINHRNDYFLRLAEAV